MKPRDYGRELAYAWLRRELLPEPPESFSELEVGLARAHAKIAAEKIQAAAERIRRGEAVGGSMGRLAQEYIKARIEA